MNPTKTIDYSLSLPYKLEIIPDKDENGYGAVYPERPGYITCGETLEGIIKNAEDAKKAWLTAEIPESQ